jgi:hypothetical protein
MRKIDKKLNMKPTISARIHWIIDRPAEALGQLGIPAIVPIEFAGSRQSSSALKYVLYNTEIQYSCI